MDSRFLSNYTKTPFLEYLLRCFDLCDSFDLTVSFIKEAGLKLIKQSMEAALRRGARGRIITSTYQNFTDVPSLELFLKWQDEFPKFECHLDNACFDDRGFHSKGYLFRIDGKYEFLVGSTNITSYALRRNVEWNVALNRKKEDAVIEQAYSEYELLWHKTLPLTHELIVDYKVVLESAIVQWDMDPINVYDRNVIVPNPMQSKALREIARYRTLGANRALVIAATGSGKTYLAAFDARRMNAKRLLFIVHRDTILLDAKETFQNIFLSRRSYGLFNGSTKETDRDFIFATNTAISLHLEEFAKDQFDYIVFDECHHAVASTYQKIMQHFEADFMLGLTATPERMDNEDVFALFGNNVPYELRLKDAIENELVVPFRYYGIRDEFVDYSFKAERTTFFTESTNGEHIDFLTKQIEEHAPKGKLKAIAFCRNRAHAKSMADAFSLRGFPSLPLLGDDSISTRVKLYSELQDDASELQIICAVDILNEGIDIPGINMVIFLRPTDSQTIFIQQLGRGLRKANSKSFLTVLDFIGNDYDRVFHVLRAIGEVVSNVPMDKPGLKETIVEKFPATDIPGVLVHFDQKSIEDVLKHIDGTNFNKKVFLAQDYANFKGYLGLHDKASFPKHMDYFRNEAAPDLIRFMRAKVAGLKSGSYYSFLKAIGEEVPAFAENEIEFINKCSSLLPIVRQDEFLILKHLLEGKPDYSSLIGLTPRITKETLEYGEKTLLKLGTLKKERDTLSLPIHILGNDDLLSYLDDLIDYGLARYDKGFGQFEGRFKLYAEYDKTQIIQEIEGVGAMFVQGTKYVGDETFLFVGLNKDKADSHLAYKDRFLSPRIFQWESVNNTTMTNAEGQKLLKTKKVHLFVRRVKEEDGITLPFVYFGTGVFSNVRETENKGRPTLTFDVILDHEVPEEYDFAYGINRPEAHLA